MKVRSCPVRAVPAESGRFVWRQLIREYMGLYHVVAQAVSLMGDIIGQRRLVVWLLAMLDVCTELWGGVLLSYMVCVYGVTGCR